MTLGVAPPEPGPWQLPSLGVAVAEESPRTIASPGPALPLSLLDILQGLPAAIRPEKPLLTFLIPYLCLTADAKLRSHSF